MAVVRGLLEEKRHLVLELVAQIPPGKVATYQQLARLAGIKNPRLVGRILASDPQAFQFPCHRVVKADGRVAEGDFFGEPYGQIIRLRQEGVEFRNGKVALKEYQWQPNA